MSCFFESKKGISIVDIFQKIISKGRKPNKILVEQGSNLRIIFSKDS